MRYGICWQSRVGISSCFIYHLHTHHAYAAPGLYDRNRYCESTHVGLSFVSPVRVHSRGYAYFLSKSLTYGYLSQVYPMMRGISTFLLPFFGVILLNERLSVWGWLGLGLIAIGFFLSSGIFMRKQRFHAPHRVLSILQPWGFVRWRT